MTEPDIGEVQTLASAILGHENHAPADAYRLLSDVLYSVLTSSSDEWQQFWRVAREMHYPSPKFRVHQNPMLYACQKNQLRNVLASGIDLPECHRIAQTVLNACSKVVYQRSLRRRSLLSLAVDNTAHQ